MALEYERVTIDIQQVEELYDSLSLKIYNDMDKQYKENKIHGAAYHTAWVELMKAVVSGVMTTVASLQMH